MKNKIFTRESLVLLIISVLGATYLLSAFGKFFDLEGFKKSITEYGFPSIMAYLILLVEFCLSIGYILLFYLKKISGLSILFLGIMTLFYTIGHFYLGIKSCDCFGAFDALNPDSYLIFTFKNLILILLSIFVYKNYQVIRINIWWKRSFTILGSLILGFSAFKYNEYYFHNYLKEKIGLSLTDIRLNIYEAENSDYLFIFSPTCIHCRKAVPVIISLNKKYSLKLTGITSISMEQELKKLTKEFDFNFPVVKIDKNIYNELAKIVPMIYKIEDDTIRDSFYPDELKSKINIDFSSNNID